VNKSQLRLIIFLSVCVLFHMLGVPAPLLDAGASFVINQSSIQEGWSIHVRCVLQPPDSRVTSVVDAEPILNVPILARSLFRPPLA
jgi:hypothetical protein